MAEAVAKTSGGLDLGGYHYAHGATYYKDGRICEAPKQLADSEQAGEVAAQASQSRWNFKDYHWEERDTLPWAKQRLEELLLGTELWRDKRAADDVRSLQQKQKGSLNASSPLSYIDGHISAARRCCFLFGLSVRLIDTHTGSSRSRLLIH